MPVLVTGASGFLGGRLAEMLVERGEEVYILARQTSSLWHLTHLPVRILYGDLGDGASLERAVVGVDRIFHCAACSTDWAPWQTYYRANVTGTNDLLEAARRSPKLRRFVHVSTTDVYGYPTRPCDETHPTVDAGLPYNQTKRMGELAVWKAHEDYGLPITIVRPATIYGPRGKDFTVEIASLLKWHLMATIDNGLAAGGFTYVDNVAEAMMQASECDAAIGQAYNIADGTHASWKDYLGYFAKSLGHSKPWLNLSFARAEKIAGTMEAAHRALGIWARPLLTQHAVRLLGIDQEFPAAKAQRDFGFAPRIGLQEGIERSAAWLKERRRS